MSRKPLAAFGFSAVAAVGASLASFGVASATPAAPTTFSAAQTPLSAPAPSVIGTELLAFNTPAAAAAPARPTTYTVRHGDTLWAIGQHYDVNMLALAAANHMNINDVLLTGKVLTLPAAGTKAPADASVAEPVAAASTSTSTEAHSSSASSVSSGSVAPTSSLESCVISRESGGNPDAGNGSYWGLFQFSRSTWAAYGGNSSDYGAASASEQEQVFNNAIAQGGASNWTPYDGC